jgi:PKD repeat protein
MFKIYLYLYRTIKQKNKMKKTIRVMAAVGMMSLFGCDAIKEAVVPKPKVESAFTFQTGANGLVLFRDKSVNATSYSWNFGDGTTSAEKNPNHQYTRNASFGVTLTATGDGSSSVSSNSVVVSGITGELTIYKSNNGGGGRNIDVKIDGVYVGTINGTYYYTAAPACSANYCVTARLSEGEHTVSAIESTGLSKTQWAAYKVTVTGGNCTTSGLRY